MSKMLLLNMASARRWKILAGDVAKPPERLRPLHAKPLPELAEAMKLSEGQLIELLGSAYGLLRENGSMTSPTLFGNLEPDRAKVTLACGPSSTAMASSEDF